MTKLKNLAILGILILFSISVVSGGNDIPQDETWVLIRADDIGAAHGINMGFRKVLDKGVVSSIEIMVPPSWYKEGVQILQNNPDVEVGVHITLTSEWSNYKWGPLSPLDTAATIVNEEGYFYSRTERTDRYDSLYGNDYALMNRSPDSEEVKQEISYQISKPVKQLSNINHLSTHMLSQIPPSLKSAFDQVSNQYDLIQVEKVKEKASKVISVWNVPPGQKKTALVDSLRNMEQGKFYYIVLHPGMITPEMKAITSPGADADQNMASHRAAITKTLISDDFKQILQQKNIKVVDHQDIVDNKQLYQK